MNLKALIALAIFAAEPPRLSAARRSRQRARADRAEAGHQDEQQTAAKEHQHAASTITIGDTLTGSKSCVDDQLRAEHADARRLQLDATRRAATYRAQAQADAQARSDLADRSEALDRQLAGGLGVVAELRADLGRRDTEVSALCDLANADAALLGGIRSRMRRPMKNRPEGDSQVRCNADGFAQARTFRARTIDQ
ncbi:MAG: hypothetical protein LBE61_20180 [Burkholderiaceae bacterium]|jgi:hypothetical protein|nr:hypothetical protein [Burkholderiaceae bacterium]